MANVHVARQPIFDSRLELWGYELLFRGPSEQAPSCAPDDAATATVLLNAFTEIGLDRLIGDRTIWMTVSPRLVREALPLALPPARTVLELTQDEPLDDSLAEALSDLRRREYKLAVGDFVYDETDPRLIDQLDVARIDVTARSDAAIARDLARLRSLGVSALASGVETRADFRRALDLGFALAQGYFFCQPETVGSRGVAPSRQSVLGLLAALEDPDVTYERLEQLITRDVALSYRLLRYINSAFFGLRHEVSSVGRALTLLGLDNVRRWTTLTAFASVEDKPRELVTTALVRARFCELAGPLFGETDSASLFTLGLFSVVDALMDAPMASVLRSIPFPPEMTRALVAGHGPKGAVLEAALASERGLADSDELERCHRGALAWATDAAASLFAAPLAA